MLKNAIWLFVITVIILVVFLPSYTQMQDLKQKNAEYTRQIRVLKQENNRMGLEINRLENDPIYLEKIARERMGLVREGEVVYRITPVLNKQGK
ncbi:MAG TPA: septum formation initiator family protein [Candidatus Omnitrophota bacterium]|nr:septum formation initiator family protein [Candidatus Omnitrophota bacterium]HPD84398.1 septum formation initiator family protein [Candidatus Omnitrophota bacterium]HRZ03256.1 septum formation initiator family protein [Candidatus Omnitrophota bacterium]